MIGTRVDSATGPAATATGEGSDVTGSALSREYIHGCLRQDRARREVDLPSARPEPVRWGAVLPPHHAGGHRPGALLLRLSRREVRRRFPPQVVPDLLHRPQARPRGRDAILVGALAARRPVAAEEIRAAPSDD